MARKVSGRLTGQASQSATSGTIRLCEWLWRQGLEAISGSGRCVARHRESSRNQPKVNGLLSFRKHRNSQSLDQSGGSGAPGDHHFCSQYLAKGLPTLDPFPEDFGRRAGKEPMSGGGAAATALPKRGGQRMRSGHTQRAIANSGEGLGPLGPHLRGPPGGLRAPRPAIASSGAGPALFQAALRQSRIEHSA